MLTACGLLEVNTLDEHQCDAVASAGPLHLDFGGLLYVHFLC